MNVTQLYGTSQAAAAQALIGGDLIADVRNDLLKQVLVAVANKTSSPSGTGDVVGPASSTDGAVTLWNGTTGKLIKDSAVFITGGGTVALGGFTLTVPATGTAALRGVANTFSAANIFSVNGAASTPALALTGTPFTGGTATTTKPLFSIEPTGTTSTGWSTSGTMLGVNAASGFTGRLADFQINGVTKANIGIEGSLNLAIGAAVNIGSTNYGLESNGTSYTALRVNGTAVMGGHSSAGGFNAVLSSWIFGFSPAINTTAPDAHWSRRGAAAIQQGSSSATPITQTFGGANGSGTNITGGTLNIGTQGTGTGVGGRINLQHHAAGSSGSTLGTLVDVLSIVGAGRVRITGIPTSAAGLSTGDIYSNAGILTIV